MTMRSVKAPPPIEMFKRAVTTQYADFQGRARRAEYWWFILISLLIQLGLVIVGLVLRDSGGGFLLIVAILMGVGLIIPGLAGAVRRLHDTNKAGTWLFLNLVPFGVLVILAFLFTDGTRSANQYGPSSKWADESTS